MKIKLFILLSMFLSLIFNKTAFADINFDCTGGSDSSTSIYLNPPAQWDQTSVDIITNCKVKGSNQPRHAVAVVFCTPGSSPYGEIPCIDLVNPQQFAYAYSSSGGGDQYLMYGDSYTLHLPGGVMPGVSVGTLTFPYLVK